MNPTPRVRQRAAFTLIELLTVIAIIGVLAAIIIPTVSRVRDSARGAQCASNQRQLAQGTLLYVADNRGFFPPPVPSKQAFPSLALEYPRWMDVIQSHLQKRSAFDGAANQNTVYMCAGDLRIATPPPTSSYAFNVHLGLLATDPNFNYRGIHLNQVKNPSRMYMIMDAGNKPWEQTHFAHLLGAQVKDHIIALRHGGGERARTETYASAAEFYAAPGYANVAFVDGHVGKFVAADAQNSTGFYNQ